MRSLSSSSIGFKITDVIATDQLWCIMGNLSHTPPTPFYYSALPTELVTENERKRERERERERERVRE